MAILKFFKAMICLTLLLTFVKTQNEITFLEHERNLVDVQADVGSCMFAIMNAVGPEFCWKKGGDVGIIPKACPLGYFRDLLLCFENCKPTHEFKAGFCWEKCKPGYSRFVFTCSKDGDKLDFYTVNSYIPKSLTNFDSKVECSQGYYKSLALCYRDCKIIGMENCGIGACVNNAGDCAKAITEMVVSILSAIAEGLGSLVSGGATTAIKEKVKEGVSKLGPTALDTVKNGLKKKFADQAKKSNILKKATEDLLSGIKDEVVGNLKVEFCKVIWDKAVNDVSINSSTLTDSVVGALDVFNIKDSIQNCKDVKDGNDAGQCAKSILAGLEFFDPTGILAIAGAFIHPLCEVTPPPIVDSNSDTNTNTSTGIDNVIIENNGTGSSQILSISFILCLIFPAMMIFD